jgi:hypothetical protein
MSDRITAVTMMRDEAPALLEWVAFQDAIGIDRIVVYTNDCRDGTDAMLDRLGQIGAPVIRRNNPASADTKPQPQALREAQKDLALLETDWLIVLDSDEFINVKVGDGRLPDLLSAVPEGTEGVVLTWRIMGSNGITDWNPGLAIESYTRGAPDDFRKGWGVKTMFRPFPDFRFGIHRPTIKGAGRDPEKRAQLSFLRWVNGSGLPMTRQFLEGMWRSSAATVGYDLAEMAHFAVKSREAYLLRQIRGNVNSKPDKYDATYFGIFDRNETEQTGLLRHLPAVQDRVASYLRDPILAGLHQDGLAWHARQIERLRAEETHPRRMARLEHLAGVAYEGLDALLFTQPLGPKGKSIVDKLRRDGMTPDAIARHVAASVARLEAERDARDFEELAALGVIAPR